MHVPGSAHQYERTGEDCGTSWRVPKAIAHPHMQGLPMTHGPVAAEAGGVAAANAQLAERAPAFRRCPKCGSDHYKQRAIRKQSS